MKQIINNISSDVRLYLTDQAPLDLSDTWSLICELVSNHQFSELSIKNSFLISKMHLKHLLNDSILLKLLADSPPKNLTLQLGFSAHDEEVDSALAVFITLLRKRTTSNIIFEIPPPWITPHGLSNLLLQSIKECQIHFPELEHSICVLVPTSQHAYYDLHAKNYLNTLDEKLECLVEISFEYVSINDTWCLEKQICYWQNLLTSLSANENLFEISLPFAERNHHPFRRIALFPSANSVYLVPAIYRPILIKLKELQLDSPTSHSVEQKMNSLFGSQLNFAKKTANCAECSGLLTCTGLLTLALMESQSNLKCVYPYELGKKLNLF